MSTEIDTHAALTPPPHSPSSPAAGYPPPLLLELASGYQRAKVLFALVELSLPTLLARRPLTADEAADALQMHPLAAGSLLSACVALGLLERVGDAFRNGPDADAYLVRGTDTYLGDEFARLDRTSYPRWADLTGHLRAWRPGATDGRLPPAEDQGERGMRERHNLSSLVGSALAAAYDFSAHALMLDIGGGSGAVTFSVCERHPALRSLIYDLPWVAELARAAVAARGCGDRIGVAEGNFKTDELPEGFDLALLANVLSVASEQTNRRLFRRIYERLPEGGAIILSGYLLDDAGSSPVVPALFCLQDITWAAPDVERTFSTYRAWLEAAGFGDIERINFCPPTSMLVGRKSKAD